MFFIKSPKHIKWIIDYIYFYDLIRSYKVFHTIIGKD